MSAPVNVLRARLNRAFHSKEMSLASYTEACELMQAIDRREVAVAELIEAGELARVELKRQHAYNTGDEAGRVWSALQAMDTALARVTGAKS